MGDPEYYSRWLQGAGNDRGDPSSQERPRRWDVISRLLATEGAIRELRKELAGKILAKQDAGTSQVVGPLLRA